MRGRIYHSQKSEYIGDTHFLFNFSLFALGISIEVIEICLYDCCVARYRLLLETMTNDSYFELPEIHLIREVNVHKNGMLLLLHLKTGHF